LVLATSVGAHLNQSKGDDDAAEWLPPHKPAVCGYVKTYVAAKAEWNLSVDEAEKKALIDVAQGCRGSTEPCTCRQPHPPWSEPVRGVGGMSTRLLALALSRSR
jgi:hypothetical protein